ncbi:transcriptional regulator [Bordetella genomosp. 1]|uniref:Cro/Cl family transcriptional regulator n=1 Tax=Bordetella genomosp. 1 TaxID=1395607 RepID=A0ABX4EWW4_9BORD|nr:YdaS family helix-turn-helix protein [Bordetella genomosp. 1]OZI58971.1 hypothetical protein CAL27_20120 [Bordetella genomosp. 1]
MNLSEYVCAQRGRQSRLAVAIRCHSVQIYQWPNGVRQVPIGRCLEIERATEGAVSRRDLRPDEWQRIWPELSRKEPKDA